MTRLEKQNFLIYSSGRFISFLGDAIQMIALPLFILDRTGSGTLMGLFSVLTIAPSVLMAPISGVIGDRLNRKKIMVNLDFARGAVILLLAFISFFGKLNIPMLFTMQVFISIMGNLFSASTSAMLPELVSENYFKKANSINASLESTAYILGPALSGLIYGIFGIKVIFLINALSFIISAFAEIFINYTPRHKLSNKISYSEFITDIKSGFGFILKTKGLKELLIFAAFANFIGGSLAGIGFPYAIREVIGFSAPQYGYMEAAFTVGTLLGSVLIGTLLAKWSGKIAMRTGLLAELFIGFLVALIMFPEVVEFFGGAGWLLFGAFAITMLFRGMFNIFVNITIQTNLQRLATPDFRSRVFATVGMVSRGAMPVGAMIYGILIDRLPIHYIFFVSAAINGVFIIFFVNRSPRETFDPVVESI